MGLIDDIKNDVKKAGANKGKIMYFREGNKTRIRFLEDMDEGHKFTFHDSFSKGINVVCQEAFGRDCHYCGDDELRTRDQYCWCVYDYDSNEVKLLLAPVNNCSPIPAIMSMYEAYGTLTDRDYVLTVAGKQQNKTFSVVPMDKNKFRNSKAKPLSDSKIFSILDKAFPADENDGDDEDDEYEDKKKKKRDVKKKRREDDYEAEDNYDDDDYDEEESEDNYDDMTPQELFKLCKKRDIDCVAKKPAKYYINLLKEADKAEDDWGDDDEDEDDGWDD